MGGNGDLHQQRWKEKASYISTPMAPCAMKGGSAASRTGCPAPAAALHLGRAALVMHWGKK